MEKTSQLIKRWKQESGVKSFVQFKVSDGVLLVKTPHPEELKNSQKYESMLKEAAGVACVKLMQATRLILGDGFEIA